MPKNIPNLTKFGRPRSQRLALIKSLAESLILDESVETTLPRAKTVARYTEKLLTKAKKGKTSLSRRRHIISSLNSLTAAHKLVDDIAPKLTGRQSGYFRIEKLGRRSGDNSLMAKVSFVDALKSGKKPVNPKPSAEETADSEVGGQITEQASIPQADKGSAPKIRSKIKPQPQKRSGIRGNR